MKSAFALIATATLLGSLAIYGTASERASQPSSGAKGADTRGTLSARVADAYAKLPLSFEANQGQADAQVQFLARGPGYGLFLTSTEAVLSLRQASGQPARLGRGHSALLDTTTAAPAVLRMQLVGASPGLPLSGAQELPGKANYFIGNDPAAWHTDIPTYARVGYENVYPGIDLAYHGARGRLEYDFIVAPGADPGAIAMRVVGADGIEIDDSGDLVLHVAGGEIRQPKPVIYQELDGVRREVSGGYTLRGLGEIGFALAGYDPTQPLVIDPVLVYSSYLGGSGHDAGRGIAVDNAGNAYVTGDTDSLNFPTPGGFQTFGGGDFDAFVTKVNAAGSALVYSSYLGGSGIDGGIGIAVDSTGNAYVTGDTTSLDFPTPGGFQMVLGGSVDAFVTKVNAAGSALVYSSYLGGSGLDDGLGIAVKSTGNAYVTGLTDSPNFPTPGGFQVAFGGGVFDAFVTKVNAAGNALVYSSYLGGSGLDEGRGIAVDSTGNAYVAGFTDSSNFPTPGGFQMVLGGGSDAFVTKVNAAGNALVYSSYLGGSGGEEGLGIAVDSARNAYVTGFTDSLNFPTPGGFQMALGGGVFDAFVTKVNAAGSALVYSSYLGGSGQDDGRGIAVDSAGNAYVSGSTGSLDFPTPGGFQTVLGGPVDAFVTKVNAAGSALVYSSYLGGSSVDHGWGIAVDSARSAYVTGDTSSPNFPTPGGFQTVLGGPIDAFVAKIGEAPPACKPEQQDKGHGQVEDEHGGNGGDFDFDECDENHQVGHKDKDKDVDFHSTKKDSAPAFDLSLPKATTSGSGLNNGQPVTYTLVVTDLGIGPGTDLYSLTLRDGAGMVIYSRTGTLRSGEIVVGR